MPHAGAGILIRARGTIVHDETKVTTTMDHTDTHVGLSTFALDGLIERVSHHMVPAGIMTQPKKVWGTISYDPEKMALTNEQTFAGMFGEYAATG